MHMDDILFEGGVHARVLPQGVGTSLHDKISIRDGEFLADFLAPIDQLRDIDLRTDRKLGAALEALVHTLGNHFPHPA